MSKYPVVIIIIAICGLVTILSRCTDSKVGAADTRDTLFYLNHHDSVRYVGMETCKGCHADIYATYTQTGMGLSFDAAHRGKSSGNFAQNHTIFDETLNLYYKPFWRKDSLWLMEFRLNGKDTVHYREQRIDYIVGSGHHTNSHLYQVNGYLFQAPFTFYTQKGKWDLPPGFESGANSRFARIIGLECLSCHNAYPSFVQGSENKFAAIPKGIDCERCHGPGSLHVAEKQKGIIIDTSRYVDRTIVNPGKLPIAQQFDLCQRCHLQGNAVLAEGKSFYDFKPGQHLHEVMTVFLPRYENDEQRFIMASHADRFSQSACFIESAKKGADEKALRPYKNAMTCVTCHNPHQSARAQKSSYFIAKCNQCHGGNHQTSCTEQPTLRALKQNDCITCHMPVTGAIDIPHVSIHDHYIRKRPQMQATQAATGAFKTLQAVNQANPNAQTRAKAYLNQFEKFDPGKTFLLDSAEQWIKRFADTKPNRLLHFSILAHWLYLKSDPDAMAQLVEELGEKTLLEQWLKKSDLENTHAWAAYRTGELLLAAGNIGTAYAFFNQAVKLAPFFPDFLNKRASLAMQLGDAQRAEQDWQVLLEEHPYYPAGWSNAGFVAMQKGNLAKAELYFRKAILLNPDYAQAIVNMGILKRNQGKPNDAKAWIERALRVQPNNERFKQMLLDLGA